MSELQRLFSPPMIDSDVQSSNIQWALHLRRCTGCCPPALEKVDCQSNSLLKQLLAGPPFSLLALMKMLSNEQSKSLLKFWVVPSDCAAITSVTQGFLRQIKLVLIPNKKPPPQRNIMLCRFHALHQVVSRVERSTGSQRSTLFQCSLNIVKKRLCKNFLLRYLFKELNILLVKGCQSVKLGSGAKQGVRKSGCDRLDSRVR
mmetsp:Transcript_10708/g.28076  ORF Transcript_10708/g.28076 Transcript_10708/m.28076 type:complete len:202 (-) Transcript_10708:341-946(-)